MLPNLKSLRDEYGISQQKLAEIINVTQQSINKYENQNTAPDVDVLIRMADYFNTSIDYLLGYTDIRWKTGEAGTYELTKEEVSLFSQIRALTPEQKECIRLTVQTFLKR